MAVPLGPGGSVCQNAPVHCSSSEQMDSKSLYIAYRLQTNCSTQSTGKDVNHSLLTMSQEALQNGTKQIH